MVYVCVCDVRTYVCAYVCVYLCVYVCKHMCVFGWSSYTGLR